MRGQGKHRRPGPKRLRKTVFFIAPLILLLLVFLPSFAQGAVPDIVYLDFDRLTFIRPCDAPGDRIDIRIGVATIENAGSWSVRTDGDAVVLLKHRLWKDMFWKIDMVAGRVFRVDGAEFGAPGGRETPMDGVEVRRNAAGCFTLQIAGASLVYKPKLDDIRLTVGDLVLMGGDTLEAARFDIGFGPLFHIRHESWENGFWEVNLQDKTVQWAVNKTFGSIRGNSRSTGIGVRTEDRRMKADDLVDLGCADMEDPPPESPWTASRKALYRDLLKGKRYDVLVAPFQVQGYALDRVGRSLITRYLTRHIAETTGARLPDPTLVMRALGEDQRTLDEREIHELADELKVKTLIMGFAGHKGGMAMNLSLVVKTRKTDASFFSDPETTLLQWKDVPFSDDHPPSEVFTGLLDDISAKLPIPKTERPRDARRRIHGPVPMPSSLPDMVDGRPDSPLAGAAYLQLMGMLHTRPGTARAHLFERSLVALSAVSPDSPDYPLLNARAWFHLHRRPAAVKALGTPGTPREKAFHALLEGDLPALSEWARKIGPPVYRLMAQLEWSALSARYGQPITEKEREGILENHGGWEPCLTRRLASPDKWDVGSSIAVKAELDRAFPIVNYTAETLLRGKWALGQIPVEGTALRLSVHRHCRRYLESHGGDLFGTGHRTYPDRADYLDLLRALGEDNLIKDVERALYLQDLPETAMKKLDEGNPVYRGHPEWTYLKSRALAALWNERRDRDLLERSGDLRSRAVYWSQGQVFSGERFECFDRDYPRRAFWNVRTGDRNDREDDPVYRRFKEIARETEMLGAADIDRIRNLSVALEYTHDDFDILKTYHRQLADYGLDDAATTLLRAHADRFTGHPRKTAFLTEMIRGKGKEGGGRESAIEAAIARTPGAWDLYFKLARTRIRKGDVTGAAAAMNRYPGFVDPAAGDRVALSNRAIQGAVELWWHGAVDLSIPFFRMAADSGTGSEAQMFSAAILAVLDGDYTGAALHYRDIVRRYGSAMAYRDYLTSLFLMGFREDAWAVFHSIDHRRYSPDIWTPVLVGLRIEGKSDDAIVQWLLQDNLKTMPSDHVERFLFISHLMDREPPEDLPERIVKIPKQFENHAYLFRATDYVSPLSALAQGLYLLHAGKYEEAARALNRGNLFHPSIIAENPPEMRIGFPYFVWCQVKGGDAGDAEKAFRALDGAGADGFTLHLARAFYHGLRGETGTALNHLKLALCRVPPTGDRPLFAWYQVVEACEWLYEETGDPEFKRLALRYARQHQRIQPMFAWAYAVEARYADTAGERLRALALTLYLDPRSARIADVPDADKKAAAEWLEQNKPFTPNAGVTPDAA